MKAEKNNIPPVNQRIKNVIDSMYKGSVRAFCLELGLPNSQKVNRLFNVDRRNNKYPTPSSDILMIISNKLGISLDWLQTGKGEMRISDAPTSIEPTLAVDNMSSKLLAVIQQQSEQLKEWKEDFKAHIDKKDQQIDRLLALLEEKSKQPSNRPPLATNPNNR